MNWIERWAAFRRTLASRCQDSEKIFSRYSLRRLAASTGLTPGALLTADSHLALARSHLEAGRLDPAYRLCREILANDPDHAQALELAGLIAGRLGQLGLAQSLFDRALVRAPDNVSLHFSRSNLMFTQGRTEECVEELRTALALAPDDSILHSTLLVRLLLLEELSLEQLAQEIAAWRARHGRTHRPAWPEHDRDPERPLRIGYVSGYFVGTGALVAQMTPLLLNHDRRQFEVFIYGDAPFKGPAHEQIRHLAPTWRSLLGRDDRSAASLIRADRIDILVGLLGHTRGERLTIFTWRPAPVQINFHGMISSGVEAMDYWLTDAVCHPDDSREHFSETLVRLPHLFAITPPADAPEPTALPAARLGQVTFGSFNINAKINRRTVALWARVLRALPESRLVLKSRGVGYAAEELRQRLSGQFAAHGIEPVRLTFLPPVPSEREHLALYGEIDLALDPVPYGGCLTTIDALWMGVPTIVLSGDRFLHRMSHSLYHTVGCDEWVATSEDEYVAKALALARDLPALGAHRASLRQRVAASRLCDGPAYARTLETVYRELWRRWCASPPAPAA